MFRESKCATCFNLPVNKDAAPCLQGILDEVDTSWKMLEQVLVVDVINLDDLMFKAFKQPVVQRQSQDGKDMADVTGQQSLPTAQREQTTLLSESSNTKLRGLRKLQWRFFWENGSTTHPPM
nr:hypothetical protein CFP56_52458 [Quercus suber]